MNAPSDLSWLPPQTGIGGIEHLLRRAVTGETSARFRDFALDSHFQPIFSIAHGRSVGVEALLRARDAGGVNVPPLQVLALPRHFGDKLLLDRLLEAMHLANFCNLGLDRHWMFLNVQPEIFVEGPRQGSFLQELLAASATPPGTLVLEVLEQAVADEHALRDAVAFYRAAGCLIAVDDFGAGYSNFDRIWRLRPDIVKLDRAMTTQATSDARARRMIPAIVALLHEAGSLVVMEGIETEAEAMLAMDSDVDFIQGYYFARPSARPETSGRTAATNQLDRLWTAYRQGTQPETDRHRDAMDGYREAVRRAAIQLQGGVDAVTACSGFLGLPQAIRCFVLDDGGVQHGPTLDAEGVSDTRDPRFAPLADAGGANWSRRFYFRRALQRPGTVQLSRPYLSMTDASQRVTLSISVDTLDGTRVLCADVAWVDRLPNEAR